MRKVKVNLEWEVQIPLCLPRQKKKWPKTKALLFTVEIFRITKRNSSTHLHNCTVIPNHRPGDRWGVLAWHVSMSLRVLCLARGLSTGLTCFHSDDSPDTERLQLPHSFSSHLFMRRLQKTASAICSSESLDNIYFMCSSSSWNGRKVLSLEKVHVFLGKELWWASSFLNRPDPGLGPPPALHTGYPVFLPDNDW